MYYKQMTSKDIWNLFNSGKLDLDKLEKEDLDTIFDIEMEELERNSAHDMSLMEKCADILMHKYSDNVTAREFTIDDIAAIEKEVLSRDQNSAFNKRRSFPRRRFIPLVAAIAIIVVVLTVVVAAYYDVFEKYGITIRDIFHMDGDVVTEGNHELDIGGKYRAYNSFEELSAAFEFKILCPSDKSGYDIVEISSAEMYDYESILVEVVSDNDVHIVYSIYYGEGAEKLFGKEQLLGNSSVQVYEQSGYKVYYISIDGLYQANMYDGDVIYVFDANSKEELEQYVNSLS